MSFAPMIIAVKVWDEEEAVTEIHETALRLHSSYYRKP
jgi:hypothetical protein